MIDTIVIVEDDLLTADWLQDMGRELEMKTEVFHDSSAFLKSKREDFCIYIIDRNLGDECGNDIIQKIRQSDRISPVFMISGNFAKDDIVQGLISGADDYMIKPFKPEVLKAKILNAREKSKNYVGTIKNRGVKILSDARLIIKDEKRLSLTGREFEVFEKLYRQPEKALSRSAILEGIEGEDVTERNVDVVIYTLRKKLAPLGVNIITVRGTGYQIELN